VNKLAHALILVVFGIACYFIWAILTLASRTGHGEGLPDFSTLCIGLRPVLIILPVMAAAYCFWIWFREAERLPLWIAAYLPLIKAVNHFAGN
jgi:hypothetical protein